MIQEDVTIYVYYKIPSQKHLHYLSAIKNLNDEIQKLYPFLSTKQQKRPEMDAENSELWMETYQNIPGVILEKFKIELVQLAEKHGLPNERKHEVFITLKF